MKVEIRVKVDIETDTRLALIAEAELRTVAGQIAWMVKNWVAEPSSTQAAKDLPPFTPKTDNVATKSLMKPLETDAGVRQVTRPTLAKFVRMPRIFELADPTGEAFDWAGKYLVLNAEGQYVLAQVLCEPLRDIDAPRVPVKPFFVVEGPTPQYARDKIMLLVDNAIAKGELDKKFEPVPDITYRVFDDPVWVGLHTISRGDPPDDARYHTVD